MVEAVNSPSANFTDSATTPHTNLLQQVSVYQTVNSFTGVYQTVNSFTGVYQTVNSFTGGSARQFALRKFHELSRHTPHQPASAGFGVSDREFIHGCVSDREFIHGCVSDREFIHGWFSPSIRSPQISRIESSHPTPTCFSRFRCIRP